MDKNKKEITEILENSIKKIKNDAADTALITLFEVIDETVSKHVKLHLLAVAKFIIDRWGEESIAKDNTDK